MFSFCSFSASYSSSPSVWLLRNSSAIRRSLNDVIEQNETMIVARNIDIGYVCPYLPMSLFVIAC